MRCRSYQQRGIPQTRVAIATSWNTAFLTGLKVSTRDFVRRLNNLFPFFSILVYSVVRFLDELGAAYHHEASFRKFCVIQ
jgi:hypothetical protein